ncbi:MAG: hypothetical protein KAQ68_07340, partial [Clostridiales bacterium]|nr:hypothetical protein [Clostridiales bacterium]
TNNMNIAIVIHSHTGNTLSIAERLESALNQKGHEVTIERVVEVNPDPNAKEKVVLEEIPDVGQYDKIIIGAPIRGFQLTPAMRTYLKNHADIKNKEVYCFVTQHFKTSLLGGNNGMRQMKKACMNNNAIVKDSHIIHWSSKDREHEIEEVIAKWKNI